MENQKEKETPPLLSDQLKDYRNADKGWPN